MCLDLFFFFFFFCNDFCYLLYIRSSYIFCICTMFTSFILLDHSQHVKPPVTSIKISDCYCLIYKTFVYIQLLQSFKKKKTTVTLLWRFRCKITKYCLTSGITSNTQFICKLQDNREEKNHYFMNFCKITSNKISSIFD